MKKMVAEPWQRNVRCLTIFNFQVKKIKSLQILIYKIILIKIYNKFIECNFVAFLTKSHQTIYFICPIRL